MATEIYEGAIGIDLGMHLLERRGGAVVKRAIAVEMVMEMDLKM